MPPAAEGRHCGAVVVVNWKISCVFLAGHKQRGEAVVTVESRGHTVCFVRHIYMNCVNLVYINFLLNVTLIKTISFAPEVLYI